MSTDNKNRGLYAKYNVSRTDGSDAPGGKHEGCQLFVLDLTHDGPARLAARVYAEAVEAEYPLLAKDLRDQIAKFTPEQPTPLCPACQSTNVNAMTLSPTDGGYDSTCGDCSNRFKRTQVL